MAVFKFNRQGAGGKGKATATAATVINVLCPSEPGMLTLLDKYVYRVTDTNAHTVTLMRPLGMTYLAAAAAASQAVIVAGTVTPSLPNTNRAYLNGQATLTTAAIAGGDYLAIRQDDGTMIVVKVSSLSGTSITLTASLSTALSAAVLDSSGRPGYTGRVWTFGVKTDTEPISGEAHPANDQLGGSSGVVSTWTGHTDMPLLVGNGEDMPILLQSDNVTTAGFFEQVNYSYSRPA
jgi:hypothetical protein